MVLCLKTAYLTTPVIVNPLTAWKLSVHATTVLARITKKITVVCRVQTA